MRNIHTKLSPQAQESIGAFHQNIIEELEKCIAENNVVLVGMALNPHVKKAKQLLTKNNIPFVYKEYGGYFSAWKERLAIKLWSGWPTFPQVFVKQTLIGGATDTQKALKTNEIQELLSHE